MNSRLRNFAIWTGIILAVLLFLIATAYIDQKLGLRDGASLHYCFILAFIAVLGWGGFWWWWPCAGSALYLLLVVTNVQQPMSYLRASGDVPYIFDHFGLDLLAAVAILNAAWWFGYGARRLIKGPPAPEPTPQPPADDWSAEDMERAGRQLEQLAARPQPRRRSALSDDVLKD